MSIAEGQLSFSKVTLLKDQALGRGSYGSVCKAKCDTLTCAAKVIHSVLFDLNDPGVRTMMSRFQQECQLLAAIKHPNIVQYLGTHRDLDSGLPVLLMELMDNSLTHFLETSPHPLPLHLQLNFSLDIATALAYLHSNNILHRDLSSNNILLLGDRRAKVTDFGMSRLERVAPRMTPATMCPGTLFYMPPEALKERPLHTDKLDVFSFGVLLVQILTRKFPEPSDRFTTLEVPDPKYKNRTIEVQAPVKEVERRQNHISLVQDSPLLAIALACLQDKQEDRPPASLVCTQLEEKQLLDEYRESAEVSYTDKYHNLKEECHKQEVAIEEIRRKLAKKREEKEMLQRLLDDKDYVIQEKNRIIKAQESKLATTGDFSLRWRKSKNAPVKFKGRGHVAVAGNYAYFHQLSASKKKIHQFDTETESGKSWEILPDPPVEIGFTIIVIHDLFLTTVGGNGNEDGKLYSYMGAKGEERWVEKFPPIGSPILNPFATTTFDRVIVYGKQLATNSMIGTVLDLETLEWNKFKPQKWFSPTFCYSANIFVRDDTVYYNAGYDSVRDSNVFYSCLLDKIQDSESWKKLHPLPQCYQTVICIKDHILGLGGKIDHKSPDAAPVKTIHRYDEDSDSWVVFGEMEVARCDCMVAVVGNKMIVVGDDDSGEQTSITDIATIV